MDDHSWAMNRNVPRRGGAVFLPRPALQPLPAIAAGEGLSLHPSSSRV